MTAPALPAPSRTAAPLGRVLLAELRWALRRPRNQLALVVLAGLPVLLGAAITASDGAGAHGRGSVLAPVADNGLVLPVAALVIAQTLLLPTVVSMVAADALAGEAAHGTLRGLLLAPVGRVRLVCVKAAGVFVLAVLSVLAVAASGLFMGWFFVGGGDLVTLSGTTLPTGPALGRVALAVGWSAVQMAAVGAVALAISAFTEHPLVVVVATMSGLIVFEVIGTIPSLEWMEPLLLSSDWPAVMDVLRDPVAGDALGTGLLRAGCYLLIGLSVAIGRSATRDA